MGAAVLRPVHRRHDCSSQGVAHGHSLHSLALVAPPVLLPSGQGVQIASALLPTPK
jgi:hypothetical protein